MIRILSAEKEVTLAMALVARVYREFDLQEGDTEGEKIMQEYSAPASVLKKTFRDQMGCGVMEYCTRLKVDAAKKLIRESDLNFSEIATRLSFNTSQYFTTVFRRVTGMTPTEYTRSVRSK